jgi:nucleoside recognition membrane protein YjiH
MTTRSVPSPFPVLIIIALAAMSLIQFLAPNLLHPGLTLFLVGVVFLILYFVNWVREAVTMITGWVLTGFGLSFWLTTYEPFTTLGLSMILFGLGLAFIGIYITGRSEKATMLVGRNWPIVPGGILLFVGVIMVLEGAISRERLWGMVVPLIPSVVAIWYIVEWRRTVAAIGQGQDTPSD